MGWGGPTVWQVRRRVQTLSFENSRGAIKSSPIVGKESCLKILPEYFKESYSSAV
jgi:hypothetical protein